MNQIDLTNFIGKKNALVLSGGVVKAAAWHLGVAYAMEELGFVFRSQLSPTEHLDQIPEVSTYVGSSAGSLVNLYLATGYSAHEVIEASYTDKKTRLKPVTYKIMLSLKRPEGFHPGIVYHNEWEGFPFIIKQMLKPITSINGIFSTHGLHQYIAENVITSNRFEDYRADMFVVGTQLDHSKKVIFSKYNYPNPRHDDTAVYYTGFPIAETCSASMSVPPFYTPYPLINPLTGEKDYYIDGEIRETLSTHVAIDNGCENIISSWVHTPYHFNKDIGSLVNFGLPAICLQAINLLIQKKIIAHRARVSTARDIVATVNEFMENENFSDTQRKNLINILERKLEYQSHVKLYDIFPDHDNYKFFFSNSFSLNKETNSEIIRMAYKATMKVFQDT